MHRTDSYILDRQNYPAADGAHAVALKVRSRGDEVLIDLPSAGFPRSADAHASASPNPRFHFVSRLFDILVALAVLIAILPVMLLVAVAIVISNPGPVIFAHRRVGKDGRTFRCYKFRSMCVGAEQRLAEILSVNPQARKQWAEDHKLSDDPRVTPLGHLLRVTSLDELPQLFNVLAGEMSLVGPRPIVEAELHLYGKYVANYLSVKPGLTGLWQVTGRSTTSYRRRVATDVLYTRTRSLALDCRILLATIPAVLLRRGSC